MRLNEIYAKYKDRCRFYLVYIREAHPTDGWALPKNKFQITDPKSEEERRKVAREFAAQLKVTIPILVDTIDDKVESVYNGWPDRIYIVDQEGRIAHKGNPGPGGFQPSVKQAPGILDKLLNDAKAK